VPREKKVSHIGYLICSRHAKEICVLNDGNSLEFIIVIIKEMYNWRSTKMAAECFI